jgi:hypothetical protein
MPHLRCADGGAAADHEDREEAGQALQEGAQRPLHRPQGSSLITPSVSLAQFLFRNRDILRWIHPNKQPLSFVHVGERSPY